MRHLMILITLWAVNAYALEGKITATEAIELNVKKGDKTFGPGEFGAKVTRTRDEKLQIEVRIAGKNNNPVAVFNVPSGKRIPRSKGTLELTAAESGQPYDLAGTWDTVVTETVDQWEQESCTYRVQETHCTPRRCETRDRIVYGWRTNRYFDRYYDLTVKAEFIRAGGATVAGFNGETTSVERVYLSRGICH